MFKVGDIVEVINKELFAEGIQIGDEAEVISIEEDWGVTIETISGETRMTQWILSYPERHIKLVESKKGRVFENVGDVVMPLPVRQTKKSAGYDLAASQTVTIQPNETKLVPTGMAIHLPEGEWAGLYIRSSIALKRNLILPNSVGVIDADFYPNEMKVMLRNIGTEPVTIEKDERIAQIIIHPYSTIDNENEVTKERDGGFGSSGKR